MTMLPYLAPEVLLCGLGILLLLLDALTNPEPRLVGSLALGGVVLIACITCLIPGNSQVLWNNLYVWDGVAKFFKLFFLVTTALVLWMSFEVARTFASGRAEFFILPLFTSAGMCLLASANDFMVLFTGLELVTISFYILVAYQRTSAQALEAGVKYLIMGALSSAFLVFGITYVFGFAGSTQFNEVFAGMSRGDVPLGALFGVFLIIVGLGFKIAAVPFHLWAPDVYQGAPTPITAFLAVGSKAAGFVLIIRVFILDGPLSALTVWEHYQPAFITIAALSLLLGNLAAIAQRNIKRMLAYSGIGHAGFMIAGLAALSVYALPSVLFYLVAYLFASMTSFFVIAVVAERLEGESIHSYAGLIQRSPLLAIALTIALVSLAGIPPLIGFMGKLGIFLALWEGQLYSLFWIGVISAIAGLYYYLGVVRVMFWSEPIDGSRIGVSLPTAILLGLLTFLTLLFGFWAQPVYVLVQSILS